MQKKTRKSFEIRTFSSFFHQKPRIFVENAHAYTYKHKKKSPTHSLTCKWVIAYSASLAVGSKSLE